MKKKLAIFASGSGSNTENICRYFSESPDISVAIICTNKKDAFVVKRAKKLQIPTLVVNKTMLNDFNHLKKIFEDAKIDAIVLAGFLLKIPSVVLEKYPKKIINIHPSLLPKYGGRGMYGDNVHRAVLKNKESETGITIHLVNENYDEGRVVLQKKCSVAPNESLKTLSKKVRKLEFKFFPPTIEKILKNKI